MGRVVGSVARGGLLGHSVNGARVAKVERLPEEDVWEFRAWWANFWAWEASNMFLVANLGNAVTATLCWKRSHSG